MYEKNCIDKNEVFKNDRKKKYTLHASAKPEFINKWIILKKYFIFFSINSGAKKFKDQKSETGSPSSSGFPACNNKHINLGHSGEKSSCFTK